MATDEALTQGETAPTLADALEGRPSKRAGWRSFFRRMLRRPPARVGLLVVIVFVLGAVLAPWLTAYEPNKADFKSTLQPPNGQHWLGTDELGRDILTRLLYGARVSLSAAFIPLTISLSIGVTLGLMAGTLRGWVDTVIMRLVDAVIAFPSLVLMIALAGIMGPSLRNALVAIGIAGFGGVARLVHGQALAVAEHDFVMAARCLGASRTRIMVRHVLPNVMAPVIVSASLGVGGVILAEASLSFLGLGIQPPNPSWGSMVSAGNPYITLAPWMSIVPGIAIFLMVLAVNFVGDGIRDAMDPYLVNR